jgi:hypothetical protein
MYLCNTVRVSELSYGAALDVKDVYTVLHQYVRMHSLPHASTVLDNY